jgi:hypothetical protein
MKKIIAISLFATALFVGQAEAGSGVKLGVLSCSAQGGIGYIIGSSKAIDCAFKPSSGDRVEHYSGKLGKLGVDIGVTGDSILAWAVFAPGKLKPGSLAGSYAGLSAEATVGAGLGANVLVGGFQKTVNLQPLSVQAQTGLNIAGGIGTLHLDYLRN